MTAPGDYSSSPTSTYLPSSTFLTSTIHPSTQSLSSILTVTAYNSVTPSATPSQGSSNMNNTTGSGSSRSSYLFKLLIPLVSLAGIFIITIYWCFRFRGKRHARNDRLKAAGIPLEQNFPPSVYPVPRPRPKTPPAAPVYEAPPGGVVLDPPPPVYEPGNVPPPPPGYREPH